MPGTIPAMRLNLCPACSASALRSAEQQLQSAEQQMRTSADQVDTLAKMPGNDPTLVQKFHEEAEKLRSAIGRH
jgi:septation ring formation regulator EzrA